MGKKPVFIYAKAKPLSLLEHIELPFLLYKNKITLFHATSYITPVWVPCKFAYGILDTYHLIFPNAFSKMAKIYFKVIVKNAAKKADVIITISESSKKDIATLIFNHKNIQVTYLATEQRFFSTTVTDLPFNVLSRYKLLEKEYILFIGNHKAHKNWKNVIIAYSELCKSKPNIPNLVLNINCPPEIKLLLDEMNCCNKIQFVNHIDDNDLPLIYHNALFLVTPSLYEGFGLFILEAMASGIPVITSNVSSMPEVAGNAALLVNPYSIEEIKGAMAQFLENEDMRRDYIQKGIKQVSKFSWEKCVQQTGKIYSEVLEK